MSTFAGGGGTLASTNLPAALIELLEKNQAQEQAVSASVNRVTTLTYNRETGVVSFGGTLQVSESQDGSGGITWVATDDLGVAFDPGTAGDLSATNFRGALLEMLNLVRQAQVAAGITSITNLSTNSLTGLMTFAGTFPITVVPNVSGQPLITVSDNL